jgi:hypothetical protein
VTAMFRAGWRWLRGYNVFVTDGILSERVEMCESQLTCFDRGSRQCKDCSCLVDVKAMFATEKCPRKKWRL